MIRARNGAEGFGAGLANGEEHTGGGRKPEEERAGGAGDELESRAPSAAAQRPPGGPGGNGTHDQPHRLRRRRGPTPRVQQDSRAAAPRFFDEGSGHVDARDQTGLPRRTTRRGQPCA